MSGTQKWGESILERDDIRSTENVNDDTPCGSELSWSGVISRVPKMSTTTRVKGTGVGPGVDVLFGTSGSSDFRHGEIAVTSGTVALVEHLVDAVLGHILRLAALQQVISRGNITLVGRRRSAGSSIVVGFVSAQLQDTLTVGSVDNIP
jgi:hypothetical protein